MIDQNPRVYGEERCLKLSLESKWWVSCSFKNFRERSSIMSQESSNSGGREELKRFDCLLNLIYQIEVEPATNIPWHELPQSELADCLLEHGIDAEFIRQKYAEEIEVMNKKREEIELFTYSRPKKHC